MKKSFPRTLIILFSAIMLATVFACTSNNSAEPAVTIKGADVEKPVREVFNMAEMIAAMFGAGGPGGAAGGPPSGGMSQDGGMPPEGGMPGSTGGEEGGGPGGGAPGGTGGMAGGGAEP